MYNKFIELFKKANLVFYYNSKKENKVYIWSAVGVTNTGRKFYFYFLSKKDIDNLLSFNFDLPKVENLNSRMEDKISYLVRKTKAHAKSFEWLNRRIAMFFVELNLKGNKIII